MGLLIFLAALFVVFVVRAGLAAYYKLPDQPLPGETLEGGDAASPIARAVATKLRDKGGQSFVRALGDGREAFAARVVAIDRATTSIDAQYYIWQDDVTGRLLMERLRQAALRGVRVRLLLDDNGISGLDGVLRELDALPSAEVRLYNPFMLRKGKMLSYLFDGHRLNHRMHNKQLIVDGAAVIVGGRNIGDDYFEYGDGAHFFDLDVLVAGPAVDAANEAFDLFWNADLSFPARQIINRSQPDGLSIEERSNKAADELVATQYLAAIPSERDLQRSFLTGGTLTDVTLGTDLPAARETARPSQHMANWLSSEAGEAGRSLEIVSAYFIPARRGMALFEDLRARGIEVDVVTNSLPSNDVPPVYGAYANYRRDLLDLGVRLFEIKPTPTRDLSFDWRHSFRSTASLHGKSLVIDGRTVFVGSFNLDPRSARLNSEMGILFDDPTLAAAISGAIKPGGAMWEVRRDEQGRIGWYDETGTREVPKAGVLRKVLAMLGGVRGAEPWL